MNKHIRRAVTLLALLSGSFGCEDTDRGPSGVEQTIRAMGADFDLRLAEAERVFVGRVESSQAIREQSEDEGWIVTAHEVTVLETLKGESAASVRVVNLGGTLGEEREVVIGQAHIEQGQHAIFFVQRRAVDGEEWFPIDERAVVELREDGRHSIGVTHAPLEWHATWPGTSVDYWLNPEQNDYDRARVIVEIGQASDAWRAQTRAKIQLNYRGTTTDRQGVDKNLVFISRTASRFPEQQLATCTIAYNSYSKLTRFQIVFNAYHNRFYSSFLGNCNPNGSKFDVYLLDVATHEFGHALGLTNELADQTATMFEEQSECETTARSLSPLDRSTLERAYGRR